MPKASRTRHAAHHASAKSKLTLDAAQTPVTLDWTKSADVPLVTTTPETITEIISEPQDAPKQTKKDKMREKREAFLQKFSSTTAGNGPSKSQLRRLKRKAREQLSGGLDNLKQALGDVASDEEPDLETIKSTAAPDADAMETVSPTKPSQKPKKANVIGVSPTATLSKAKRKRVLELERLRQPLIVSNPDFSANPFAAIRVHAQNTLVKHQPPSS